MLNLLIEVLLFSTCLYFIYRVVRSLLKKAPVQAKVEEFENVIELEKITEGIDKKEVLKKKKKVDDFLKD